MVKNKLRRACGRLRRFLFAAIQVAVLVAVCGHTRLSQAAPRGFAFGQQVEARSPGVAINLRGEPGLAGRVVTTLANGTTVTVIGGPKVVDGVSWWEVDGGTWAAHGWAAEGLLKPALVSPAQDEPARRAQCAVTGPVYPGIYHCQRASNVHVIVIDLNDPHVRFETIMAQDGMGADGAAHEWVGAMAERMPGAVAAINGDYFGEGGQGPEGLTIRNGVRLDQLDTMERSALVIGQAPLDDAGAGLPIPAEIMRLEDVAGPLDPARHFNAVGGGPQIVFASAWRWTEGFGFPGYRGCAADLPADQVINGECLANIDDWLEPEKPWSAAGLTRDHRMVWVVGPYAHVADTLAAFGVETALKLDSGGSSQLWYDRTMVQGYRPVPNGLLAFYQQSAEVVGGTRWLVLAEGERGRMHVTLRNTGADTWKAGEVTLERPRQGSVPLPHAVQPGETVTLRWMTAPTMQCGIQDDTWQLSENGEVFPGPEWTLTSIVLPAAMAAERSDLMARLRDEAEGRPRPAFLAAVERTLRANCADRGSVAGGYR